MTFDVLAHGNLRQQVFRQRERRCAMQRAVWLGVACLGIVVAAPVSFSPDGKTLASGSSDQMIKLWDLNFAK